MSGGLLALHDYQSGVVGFDLVGELDHAVLQGQGAALQGELSLASVAILTDAALCMGYP